MERLIVVRNSHSIIQEKKMNTLRQKKSCTVKINTSINTRMNDFYLDRYVTTRKLPSIYLLQKAFLLNMVRKHGNHI